MKNEASDVEELVLGDVGDVKDSNGLRFRKASSGSDANGELGGGAAHLVPGSDTPQRVKWFQQRPRDSMHMGPTMQGCSEREKHDKTCCVRDQPCKFLKAYHEKAYQAELRYVHVPRVCK